MMVRCGISARCCAAYLGCRGNTWGNSSDPTIGHIDMVELLTGVLTHIERGALRRCCDDINRGTKDWWLDRINLLST